MADDQWWGPAEGDTDPASAPPAAVPSAGPPGAPDPSAIPTPVHSSPEWVRGERSATSVLITIVVILGLIGVLIALRSSADSVDTSALEPVLAVVDDSLSSGVELVGDSRPSRADLGLDGSFTEPRAWRQGGALIVAYARAADDGDGQRVAAEGTIAATLLDAAGAGAAIRSDSLRGGAPPVRVVELELADGTTILHATGVSEDGAVVLIVSASGRERPAVDVARLAEEALAVLG